MINDLIEIPSQALAAGCLLGWRDEENNLVRKGVSAAALAGVGIAGLIDVILSIALAILSSPFILAGHSLSTKLFKRAWIGICFCFYYMPRLQCQNAVKEKVLLI